MKIRQLLEAKLLGLQEFVVILKGTLKEKEQYLTQLMSLDLWDGLEQLLYLKAEYSVVFMLEMD
jgi:hypothetical protein